MMGASRHNEGKLHLGYVYAADDRRETHRILSRGSLGFVDLLARLTGFPASRFVRSDAFTYIVPSDSARSVEQIHAYFEAVDDTVAAHCAETGRPALQRTARLGRNVIDAHYGAGVQAAFSTPEIAVDPGQVSDIVAAAVYAHPLITFWGGHRVVEVTPQAGGRHSLSLTTDAGPHTLTADAVINATWEDRLRLDAQVGHVAEGTWSQRWKATVMIDVPAGSVTIPSTTGLVGSYGDFVLYGRSRIYVSWYPVCRLSMSTSAAPDTVRDLAATTDAEAIRTGTITNLSRLIPDVQTLLEHKANTSVGGGFIMAVGAQDIDDRRSGLHSRHQIGVEGEGTWVSVSTGKFCTAPMFGEAAARHLDTVLA